MSVRVLQGDCRKVLVGLEADSFAACVTDPPYHLQAIHKRFAARGRDETSERYAAGPYGRHAKGFMGKQWDGGDVAFRPETWAAVLRALKPGAHLVAFASTRGYHRMVCAIEDAGFEIRDQLGWLYASGFPKSHDFAAYRDVNNNRVVKPEFIGHPQADGFGTALKPAWEPIVLARKPLSEGTVAANVLRWGTGALNIDAGRVATVESTIRTSNAGTNGDGCGMGTNAHVNGSDTGRWPANLAHDGSPEVMEAFARFGERSGQAAAVNGSEPSSKTNNVYGQFHGRPPTEPRGDTGTAARFFFCGKAQSWEREGDHPTVKPVALMEWLVGLVTPPGGAVLDPFCGTGSTLVACDWLGIEATGIEQDAKTCADAERKVIRLRARRLLGPDAPRPDVLPGQLDLLAAP